MQRPPHPKLLEFLAPYHREIQAVALALRDLVLATAPGLNELVYRTYVVAVGFSFTSDWRDGPCHIAVYPKHVNLGFQRGALLPDPDGVMEGTGKAIRHIKVESAADLKRPLLKRYLRAAIAGCEKGTGGQPTTTIKTTGVGRKRPVARK